MCRHELIYDLGTVKLADFGLSKTLPVNKHAGFDLDDKFKLTGETGSYRFMAREVFVHEAYNNKVAFSCSTPTEHGFIAAQDNCMGCMSGGVLMDADLIVRGVGCPTFLMHYYMSRMVAYRRAYT